MPQPLEALAPALALSPGPPPRVHGGTSPEELQAFNIHPEVLLDFSVNTNPYGPCAALVEAVRAAPLHRYPEVTGRSARQALAEALGISRDRLALGNGAVELLWALARSLLGPQDCALIVEPTFCEFRAAAQAMGARICEWRAQEAAQFAIQLENISLALHREKPAVVYLCVPNTPTGASLPAADIAAWAAQHPHCLLVLDQSFLALSQRFEEAHTPMPPNVLRVLSLTKEFTIPGVRLGYLVASEELVARLERTRPLWMTSTLAQAAAIASCGQQAFVADSRRKLLQDRRRLALDMRRLGYRTVDSTTNFFLLRVPNAQRLRQQLLARHHIAVRDCTSFGLPHYIRLAARPASDCARLLRAFQQEEL